LRIVAKAFCAVGVSVVICVMVFPSAKLSLRGASAAKQIKARPSLLGLHSNRAKRTSRAGFHQRPDSVVDVNGESKNRKASDVIRRMTRCETVEPCVLFSLESRCVRMTRAFG
jgi:hypothetical protein